MKAKWQARVREIEAGSLLLHLNDRANLQSVSIRAFHSPNDLLAVSHEPSDAMQRSDHCQLGVCRQLATLSSLSRALLEGPLPNQEQPSKVSDDCHHALP